MARPSASSRLSLAVLAQRLLACSLLVLATTACTPDMKAQAYAGSGRDDWQQADRVIATLDLEAGDVVADLGAGGGYFTFLLADAVGPTGRVFAVDVDEAMNERLAGIASERGYANVEAILAVPSDPKIPSGGVDLVFTSNTYHHIEDRPAYFQGLTGDLRGGGRLAVIDYKEEGFMQGLLGHSTDASIIQRELESAGYTLVERHDFIEKQHFLIFAPGEL